MIARPVQHSPSSLRQAQGAERTDGCLVIQAKRVRHLVQHRIRYLTFKRAPRWGQLKVRQAIDHDELRVGIAVTEHVGVIRGRLILDRKRPASEAVRDGGSERLPGSSRGCIDQAGVAAG